MLFCLSLMHGGSFREINGCIGLITCQQIHSQDVVLKIMTTVLFTTVFSYFLQLRLFQYISPDSIEAKDRRTTLVSYETTVVRRPNNKTHHHLRRKIKQNKI
jgi:hypothetical protein